MCQDTSLDWTWIELLKQLSRISMARSSKCFKWNSWGHFCPCPQLKPQQLQINFLRPFMTKMPFKRLCIWGTPLGSFECLKRDSCGHFCTCPQPKPQQLKMDFLRRFMTKTPSKYDTPLQHVRRILVWGTPLGSFCFHSKRTITYVHFILERAALVSTTSMQRRPHC